MHTYKANLVNHCGRYGELKIVMVTSLGELSTLARQQAACTALRFVHKSRVYVEDR